LSIVEKKNIFLQVMRLHFAGEMGHLYFPMSSFITMSHTKNYYNWSMFRSLI